MLLARMFSEEELREYADEVDMRERLASMCSEEEAERQRGRRKGRGEGTPLSLEQQSKCGQRRRLRACVPPRAGASSSICHTWDMACHAARAPDVS